MFMKAGIIEQAQAWISLEVSRERSPAPVSDTQISPDGHVPVSLSWILEGGDFMAQVTLWETGEFETDFAEVATGQVHTRGGRVASSGELQSVLASARDWVLQDA
jgi:hypothetical protein